MSGLVKLERGTNVIIATPTEDEGRFYVRIRPLTRPVLIPKKKIKIRSEEELNGTDLAAFAGMGWYHAPYKDNIFILQGGILK